MNIDEFPVEILMKIFSYLPKYGNIALVNKQFYSIVSTLSDPKICLCLSEYLLEQKKALPLLQSVQKTNRNVTKIIVSFWSRPNPEKLKLMFAIVKKFSSTIKYFKFHGDLQLSDFLKMLSLIPNVEHLQFEFVQTPEENQPAQKKRRVMPSNDLNFHKLKTLKFRHCNDAFVVIFNRLPSDVLTELKLDHRNLDELKVLFMRQTKIKNLTVNYNSQTQSVANDLLDNQKLETLEWHDHHINISNILSKQVNLKSLQLIDGVIDEDLMNVVTDQLTELETLSMFLGKAPVGALKNIAKLKKLSDLTLRADENGDKAYFEEFSRLDNSRITILDIQFMCNISDDLIAKLAKSVPNLKILRFNCDYKFRIFNAIMKSFNFVKTLHFDPLDGDFDFYYEHNFDDDTQLIQSECMNLNLVELKITYQLPYKRVFLKKLIRDYPNLKKLIIHSTKPLNSSQFKLILNGFNKMESLSLVGGASKLNMDDLNCLKEHTDHLKFISITDLHEIKSTVRIKKKLSTIFDVVNFTFGLQMAVDRKTMKSETTYRYS